MKQALLLFCLFSFFSISVCTAAEPNAVRDKFVHDTTVQGHPCARGEAWFYPNGALNQCQLSRPAILGDLRIPRGSIIELWPSGAAHHITLSRQTVVAGYTVRGASHLGFRGATTSFYRNGELRSIYLVKNQTVQGVPCRGGSWNTFTDPYGDATLVEFYPDGKFESCKLARNYGGLKAGQRLELPFITTATAAAAPPAPTIPTLSPDPAKTATIP
jgi:hypothetical protein